MSEPLAVDIISDLNLTTAESFDWDDKPTALFCVIPGGISSDLKILDLVFEKLSRVYRGVFYIDSGKDHINIDHVSITVDKITEICKKYNNVVYLHNHVVILNHVALVGINGWYKNTEINDPIVQSTLDTYKMQDIAYLSNAIKTLKKHSDVNKVLVISACVPAEDFLYQQVFDGNLKVEPAMALYSDDEKRVKTWIFGSSRITVDTEYNERRFVNNPCLEGQPYWPKRVVV